MMVSSSWNSFCVVKVLNRLPTSTCTVATTERRYNINYRSPHSSSAASPRNHDLTVAMFEKRGIVHALYETNTSPASFGHAWEAFILTVSKCRSLRTGNAESVSSTGIRSRGESVAIGESKSDIERESNRIWKSHFKKVMSKKFGACRPRY
jgi:hypothetical protein